MDNFKSLREVETQLRPLLRRPLQGTPEPATISTLHPYRGTVYRASAARNVHV